MSKMLTILDGGMGMEMIHRFGEPDGAMWSADVLMKHPDLVTDIHLDFIKAGADIITTSNYSVTRPRLTNNQRADEMSTLTETAMTCARHARDKADRSVRIASSLPPLVASYHPEDALSYAKSKELYAEMCELTGDTADLFLCETMASIDEARGAVDAAAETGKPVICSFVTKPEANQPPRLRDGTPLAEAIRTIGDEKVEAWMVNCIPPEFVAPCMSVFATGKKPFGAYANGFSVLPDGWRPKAGSAQLGQREDLDPATYAGFARTWRDLGASVIGGCCNVGPEHIQSLRQSLV